MKTRRYSVSGIERRTSDEKIGDIEASLSSESEFLILQFAVCHQRAGRVGARVGSTKHEERRDTKDGVVKPGGSEPGPVLGGERRRAAVDANEAAPKTGEELVIMPDTVIKDEARL